MVAPTASARASATTRCILAESAELDASAFPLRPTLLVTQKEEARHGILLAYADPMAEGFVRATIHRSRDGAPLQLVSFP